MIDKVVQAFDGTFFFLRAWNLSLLTLFFFLRGCTTFPTSAKGTLSRRDSLDRERCLARARRGPPLPLDATAMSQKLELLLLLLLLLLHLLLSPTGATGHLGGQRRRRKALPQSPTMAPSPSPTVTTPAS